LDLFSFFGGNLNYSFVDLSIYFIGFYLVLLAISCLILRKRGLEPREIEAYEDYIADFEGDEAREILLIPGSLNLLSVTQTVAFSQCLKFLTNFKDELKSKNVTIAVTCPFKYSYLCEHIDLHQLNAKVEFLALDQASFIMAGMGFIERNSPNLTFFCGSFGYEVLILGEVAGCHGNFYSAPENVSSLPDATVASKDVVMGEELFALPYWEKTEESDFADKVFFLTNDIVKALIILGILFGSAYQGYLTFID
jgi:hypothetical protein